MKEQAVLTVPGCSLDPKRTPKGDRKTVAPEFIDHLGFRVLKLDFTGLEPRALPTAFDKAHTAIATEPPASLRVLTILNGRFDEDAVLALRKYAVDNRPFVRRSAVVVAGFWHVVVTSIKLHERRDLMIFEETQSALDWLAQ